MKNLRGLTNEEVAKTLIAFRFAGGPYAEENLIKMYKQRGRQIYGLLGVYKHSFKEMIEEICGIELGD